MTIEVGLVITLISVAASVIGTYLTQRRAGEKDIQNDASQQSAVMLKLEFMNASFIKLETKLESKFDIIDGGVRDVRERLIILEQSNKSAHKRIDAVENNGGKNE